MLQRVPGRLPEAMVERAAPGAAHLIDDAVENDATLLVGVEALIQEMPEEASRLRDAPPDGETHPAERVFLLGGGVLEEADEVARAREAAAHDARVLAAVDDVVDESRLEAAVERDRLAVDEAPALAGDGLGRIEGKAADGHLVLRARGIENEVGAVSPVGERGRRSSARR